MLSVNKTQIFCGRSLNFTLYMKMSVSCIRLIYNKGKVTFCSSSSAAPWYVGELFDDVNYKKHYSNTMMIGIVDECLPLKKMRVRSKDVPCMTTVRKNTIRAKRKTAEKYHKDKSAENWEDKIRCRNEATRQCRLAIRPYWKKKASELKSNPRDFFRTFKPFLGSKRCSIKDVKINLRFL